ncbi:MAG: S8 family serine peptidase [Gemmatimonadota bacterium]
MSVGFSRRPTTRACARGPVRALSASALALVLAACGGQAEPAPTPSEPAPRAPDLTRIDGPVLALLEGSARVPVVILMRTQVAPGPGGLGDFARENAGAARSSLRSLVSERLKTAAYAEHAELRALLDLSAETETLWIVNAVVGDLLPDEVLAASASDLVRYIYLGDGSIRRDGPGQLRATLSPPASRAAFSVGGRKVDWNLVDVGARRVWEDFGATGEGVVVAMLDWGINYTHEDLRDNIWTNPGEIPSNGVDDDGNGYTDDYYGFDFGSGAAETWTTGTPHGTWTSGIVAGDGTGGTVTGVAPRARLMSLVPGSTVATLAAIQYAVVHGADVINMSFSRPGLENVRGLWRLAADHATAAGVLLVSGAGNFRTRATVPEQLRVPEDIPSVVAAGGVDQDLQVAPFSSMGPVSWSGVALYGDHATLVKPDVAGFPGPGYALLDPSGSGYLDPNTSVRGNSFSGPHAAGVAALVMSANPELPAWEVGRILQETARDVAPAGRDNDTGEGLLDAYAAVREALGQ